MKFYELSQEVQDMLVERQRDYITSCMDWLEGKKVKAFYHVTAKRKAVKFNDFEIL